MVAWPGFYIPDHVVTMRVSLSGDRYEQAAARTAFYDELIRRVSERPGVTKAGAISFLPMTGLASATSFTVVGRPKPAAGQESVADVRVVSGDYFGAMGIPLIRGRLFQPTDRDDRAHVVLISRALAEQQVPWRRSRRPRAGHPRCPAPADHVLAAHAICERFHGPDRPNERAAGHPGAGAPGHGAVAGRFSAGGSS